MNDHIVAFLAHQPVGEGSIVRHILGFGAGKTRERALESVRFEQRTQP